MGLEKIGTTMGKDMIAWIRACGKTSILQTRPVGKFNIEGLKYKPIKSDTFTKIKKIETWMDDTPNPFAKEGLTNVRGHHDFHAWSSNATLEDEIRYIKSKNLRADLESKRIERAKIFDAENEIAICDINKSFKKLMPQPKDSVVFRGRCRRKGEQLGSDFDVIKNAQIGDEIIPARGFTYSAHNKIGAAQYLGLADESAGLEGLLIETRIPKNSQVSVNMEHGGEVVFPGFSKYKLISKETRYIRTAQGEYNGIGEFYPYTHAVLEYIPEIRTDVPESIVKLANSPLGYS